MKLSRLIGIFAIAATVVGLIAMILSRVAGGPPPGIETSAQLHAVQTVSQISIGDLLWYLIAGGVIASAAITAFHPNIVYAAIALLGSFGGVAGFFIYLSADFLAVTQVAVYIGGVMVLVMFAVMLTNRIGEVELSNPSTSLPVAAGLGALLLGLVGFIAVKMPWAVSDPAPLRSTAADLGNAFLQDYLLPFEVASVVLLAVLVGAVIIVRKEVRPES